MAINRAGSGGVRTTNANGFSDNSTTTVSQPTSTQSRPLNQTQSSFTSAPTNTPRGPNLGQQQPVRSQQASTSSSNTSQFDFDVAEMRREFEGVHKSINTEKYKHNGKEVEVKREGDSTDRASKIMLEALTNPELARKILKEGIPSEGVSPPQPRTQGDRDAAVRAEAELAAAAAKRGEKRDPQPIAPSLHEVLTKVANGETITRAEMQQMGGVVQTWSKGNRMVLDGFYAAMLAAAKKEPNRW